MSAPTEHKDGPKVPVDSRCHVCGFALEAGGLHAETSDAWPSAATMDADHVGCAAGLCGWPIKVNAEDGFKCEVADCPRWLCMEHDDWNGGNCGRHSSLEPSAEDEVPTSSDQAKGPRGT